MPKIKQILLFLCISIFAALLVELPKEFGSLQADSKTNTYYDKERSAYITKGFVDIDAPLSHISKIANNFNRYPEWVILGINGDDKNSRGFLNQ